MTELLLSPNFFRICATSHYCEVTTAKRIKIDQHCQRQNSCTLKVLFNHG